MGNEGRSMTAMSRECEVRGWVQVWSMHGLDRCEARVGETKRPRKGSKDRETVAWDGDIPACRFQRGCQWLVAGGMGRGGVPVDCCRRGDRDLTVVVEPGSTCFSNEDSSAPPEMSMSDE